MAAATTCSHKCQRFSGFMSSHVLSSLFPGSQNPGVILSNTSRVDLRKQDIGVFILHSSKRKAFWEIFSYFLVNHSIIEQVVVETCRCRAPQHAPLFNGRKVNVRFTASKTFVSGNATENSQTRTWSSRISTHTKLTASIIEFILLTLND